MSVVKSSTVTASVFEGPRITEVCRFSLSKAARPPVASVSRVLSTIAPRYRLSQPRLPSAFFPSGASPFFTSPLSFKSKYQLSVSPPLLFSVNVKIACPFLTASFLSLSSAWRAELIASKASDEGKESAKIVSEFIFLIVTRGLV
jgi:hypothetical protein